MFILDLETEKIKEVDNWQVCEFINGLIASRNMDLLNKRYLFVPTAEAAEYIITKSITH
jgi:hypothetical protein